MNTYQRYMQYRKDELYHYNQNHDPKDGKFTFAKGVRRLANKASKLMRKIDGTEELDRMVAKKQKNEADTRRKLAPGYEKKTTDMLKKDFGFKIEFDELDEDVRASRDVKTKDAHGDTTTLELAIYVNNGIRTSGVDEKKLSSDIKKIENDWPSIDRSVRNQLADLLYSDGRKDYKPVDKSGNEQKPGRIAADLGASENDADYNPFVNLIPTLNGSKTHSLAEIWYQGNRVLGRDWVIAEYDMDSDKVIRYSIEG